MSELQFQLLVVFSFKTVGKQIGFTLRPFVFKALKLVLANRQLNKAMSFSGTVAKGTIKKIPGGNAALELQDKIVDAGLEFTDNVLDAALGAGQAGTLFHRLTLSSISFRLFVNFCLKNSLAVMHGHVSQIQTATQLFTPGGPFSVVDIHFLVLEIRCLVRK